MRVINDPWGDAILLGMLAIGMFFMYQRRDVYKRLWTKWRAKQ